MSAVYHPKNWDALYNGAFNAIVAYVQAHPGESLDSIATGTNTAYSVVYAVCQNAGMIVLPSMSGEIQWPSHKR